MTYTYRFYPDHLRIEIFCIGKIMTRQDYEYFYDEIRDSLIDIGLVPNDYDIINVLYSHVEVTFHNPESYVTAKMTFI